MWRSRNLTCWTIISLYLSVLTVADSKSKCGTCTKLTNKFDEEMENTKGRSSGAGNTDWEESRGIKWDTSDTRLAEILEQVCSKSDLSCLEFLEEGEQFIEEWWAQRKTLNGNINVSLHSFLCIIEIKICCETGRFGRSCKDCPGGAQTPCSNHGECEGSGDRSGNGVCNCDDGYVGKRCAKCSNTHFKSEGKNQQFSCEKCHTACSKKCTGPTTKDCVACRQGFELRNGCEDIDECADNAHNCSAATYCLNSHGSFTCEPCNPACDKELGCVGPTTSNCVDTKCASGYKLKDGECIDIDECLEKSSCEVGEYCINIPGAYTCRMCHPACDPSSGCSGDSPADCLGCVPGWTFLDRTSNGCEDVNECENSETCPETTTCLNSVGSFSCICEKPRQMVDGTCVLVEDENNEALLNSPTSKDEL